VITQAFEALNRTGALQARVLQPAPELVRMRDDVSRLVANWDDALADSIAAMNLFMDEARDRRKVQITALRAQVGECSDDGSFEVENALRGSWRLRCQRGGLDISITLAPTVPPRVQYLNVEYAAPGEPRTVVGTCPNR
jgi:hypothetical protein